VSFLAVVNEGSDQLDAIFDYVVDWVTILSFAEALALPLLAELGEEEVVDDTMSLMAESAVPEAMPPENVQTTRKSKASFIRVEHSLINHLMDLLGEIIIAKNSLPYLCRRAREEFQIPLLAEGIDRSYADINHVVEGLQGIAMDIRMLPAANAFERFPRLVRDISHKLGKTISLELQGENTRADKDVIEALTEPLVHLVRNCLDHGIEMPHERVAAGKPAEGHIILRAGQESSSLVIEISDDGKGINPTVIRQKAAAKGIVTAEALAAMADDEVIQLVMAPNFSTAEAVSDLSGRGVGMDAVKTMVTGLQGTLHLASSMGKGTTIRLTLPLSRAITKILTIRQDGCTFGIPADNVIESLIDIPHSMIKSVLTKPRLNVRNDIYPLYSLARYLRMQPADAPFPEKFSAVLVRVSGEIFALAVEEFSDIMDVIVKPLQGMLAANTYYTGNTLLGDGSILFLLNMQELSRHGR
jgi:two-component system chemotaxis sensor kinase CheA